MLYDPARPTSRGGEARPSTYVTNSATFANPNPNNNGTAGGIRILKRPQQGGVQSGSEVMTMWQQVSKVDSNRDRFPARPAIIHGRVYEWDPINGCHVTNTNVSPRYRGANHTSTHGAYGSGLPSTANAMRGRLPPSSKYVNRIKIGSNNASASAPVTPRETEIDEVTTMAMAANLLQPGGGYTPRTTTAQAVRIEQQKKSARAQLHQRSPRPPAPSPEPMLNANPHTTQAEREHEAASRQSVAPMPNAQYRFKPMRGGGGRLGGWLGPEAPLRSTNAVAVQKAGVYGFRPLGVSSGLSTPFSARGKLL